jgi:hypothetical protein
MNIAITMHRNSDLTIVYKYFKTEISNLPLENDKAWHNYKSFPYNKRLIVANYVKKLIDDYLHLAILSHKEIKPVGIK